MDLFKKLYSICETKSNVKLKYFSSMHVGGTAMFMCWPKTESEIVKLVKFLNKNAIQYYLIANGTNILFKDAFYDVVFISLKKYNKVNVRGKALFLDSGASVIKACVLAKENSLTGLEWCYGLPGSIGGAVIQNAGAYGSDISKYVKSVKVLDTKSCKTHKLSGKNIKWGYRQSSLKNSGYVILSVKIKLKKGIKDQIEYVSENYLAKRKQTQPLKYYNLGSIFKNPTGLYAGKLIEECGFKGKQIGDACVSCLHANFIVNQGEATSQDVLTLINQIQQTVQLQKGVMLEPEIVILET